MPNQGLFGAYLSLVWGECCMGGSSMGVYEGRFHEILSPWPENAREHYGYYLFASKRGQTIIVPKSEIRPFWIYS